MRGWKRSKPCETDGFPLRILSNTCRIHIRRYQSKLSNLAPELAKRRHDIGRVRRVFIIGREKALLQGR